MCKKKKKVAPVVTEQVQEFTLENFELQKPEPAYDENGKRDYFTEYYNAYKNDYIDQYLAAYRKFKEDGTIPEYNPYAKDSTPVQPAEKPAEPATDDEIDVDVSDEE